MRIKYLLHKILIKMEQLSTILIFTQWYVITKLLNIEHMKIKWLTVSNQR